MRPVWFDVLNLKEQNYLLFTMNRHAILTNKENLKQLMQTLVKESNGMPIVAPLHTYVADAIKELNIRPTTFTYFLRKAICSSDTWWTKPKAL